MSYIYVNFQTGSDSTGSGAENNPYKTIQVAVNNSYNGDTVIVQNPGNILHEEPDSIVLSYKRNITIRVEPYKSVTVKPVNISNHYTFVLNNCDNVSLSGFDFTSANNLQEHKGAVLVSNSDNITLSYNTINESWKCSNTDKSSLFCGENSNVLFDNLVSSYLENSYPVYNASSELSFIRVSGNGDYTIRSCACSNMHSNSGWTFGLKIDADTRSVDVDDFQIYNLVPEHVDVKTRMIGIHVSSDASPVNIKFRNISISKTGYALCFENIPLGNTFDISRLILDETLYSAVLVKNNSYVTLRNMTVVNNTNALEANFNSVMSVYNSIIYDNETVFVANNESLINLSYSIYFKYITKTKLGTGGRIDTHEFTRNINPKFVNPDSKLYSLADGSPAIDSGKIFPNDSYLGFGPDLGFYERGPKLTDSDLPALLARKTRMSQYVPLTDIDVVGVIEKGLETSDGTILAGREGSAVRDVAVKPLDLLLEPYFSELESIRSRISFDNLENLTEDDADLLAANLFVNRDPGEFSSGVVRLYFNEAQDATVYAEHEFKTADGLSFFSRNTVSISKDEMLLNYDKNGYYMDIVVDAAEADVRYNIPAHSITISTMPLPIGVTTFINPFDFTGGRSRETNDELKEKIKYSISVRDIVTVKGAKATMLDKFPFVTDVRTIGFRDPEMERDLINGSHIGGKMDIYIKTRQLTEDSKVITPTEKYFEITDSNFSGFVPLMRITKIELLEPLTLLPTGQFLQPGTDFTLKSYDPLHRFSVYERLAIEFSDYIVSTYMPTTPMRVYFEWIPEMKTIQDAVLSDDERVVVADVLVRAFDPVFISFTLPYRAQKEIENLDVMLKAYIIGLKNTVELHESDIVNFVYGFGATKVEQPLELVADYCNKDGSVFRSETPDSVIINRTQGFWPGNITVTYMGSTD